MRISEKKTKKTLDEVPYWTYESSGVKQAGSRVNCASKLAVY